MKSILLSLTYLIGISEVFLAFYFWRNSSKNEIRRVMAFLALVTGLWVITTAINSYSVSPLAEFRDKFTYTFGVLIVTALLNFTIVFPYPMFRLDRLHYIFLYLPAVIFTLVIFGSHDVVSRYISSPTLSGQWFGGPLYWMYNGYLLVLYVWAMAVLYSKFKKTDGIHHRNLILVFWSIFLGGAPGIVVDVIVPLVTNQAKYPLIGVMSSVVWLGLTTYIILKK
ncbi:MAG: histidine kinase N-terminal 7TM domain-containing protein [Patescibacteria group bacterium]